MRNGGFTMMIKLLDKAVLSILNRKLKYPLAIAEKDYFLALAIQVIFNSALRDKLIFKGGTAIYHTYLPQLRFSEDLDFSCHLNKFYSDEITSVLEESGLFEIKKEYHSKSTYKVERLLYKGPLMQANSLKIEIDFTQNTVLPPLFIPYHNEYSVHTNVSVMDIREITAEKIRAMSDRVRFRDFYDFSMILKEVNPNLNEVIDLIGKKEIRKTISCQNIMSNWELAKKDKNNELQAIHFSRELSEKEMTESLQKLRFPDFHKNSD
jgi:predicted nucleotidyltransferase component of viral defense system